MNSHYKIADNLSKLLDNRFNIFGLRFGIDPILGLIPGLGDIISLALSLYTVWIATQMRLPQGIILRMVFNVVLDFLIGLVPILGDLSDFVYKANTRNMEILRKYGSRKIVEGQVI